MLNNFINNLINQLAENSFALSDQAIPRALAKSLLQDLDKLHDDGGFKQASIGRGHSLQTQKQIRGDEICWLDEIHPTDTQRPFFDFMNLLSQSLNESFFIGIKELEAHYAFYPPGSGYERHIDQHAGTSHRKITFILYLNENWQVDDGGELLVYDPQEPDKILQQVQPLFGRLILFRSEVFPHQVATSHSDRKSLTGWFRS